MLRHQIRGMGEARHDHPGTRGRQDPPRVGLLGCSHLHETGRRGALARRRDRHRL